MALDSSSVCQRCSSNVESVDHLLIHCHVVYDIWFYFLRSAGRLSAMPQSVERVVVSWKGYNLMEQGKQLWRKLQAAIMWVVWLARNAKFFNSKDIKVPDIIRDIKIQAFNWAKGASCFAGTELYPSSDLFLPHK
ncbi:uncharacterized protein LOC113315710 [Papaver somniferum]|uniref:uncharacterized protein LOC113315710 n=1 Tax=Papaver somniferum TaxID=3469 RepID=UPI000E6F8B9A|nr:uncharacterized protein LOC113315710 [Papaver somniferum]